MSPYDRHAIVVPIDRVAAPTEDLSFRAIMDSMRYCTPLAAQVGQSGSADAPNRSRPEHVDSQSDVPIIRSTAVAMMPSSIAHFSNSYHVQAAASMPSPGWVEASYHHNIPPVWLRRHSHQSFGYDSRRSSLSAPTLHYHTLHTAQAVHTGPDPTPCHVGFPIATRGPSCEATYERYRDSQFPNLQP